jgi:hypothetical protein
MSKYLCLYCVTSHKKKQCRHSCVALLGDPRDELTCLWLHTIDLYSDISCRRRPTGPDNQCCLHPLIFPLVSLSLSLSCPSYLHVFCLRSQPPLSFLPLVLNGYGSSLLVPLLHTLPPVLSTSSIDVALEPWGSALGSVWREGGAEPTRANSFFGLLGSNGKERSHSNEGIYLLDVGRAR